MSLLTDWTSCLATLSTHWRMYSPIGVSFMFAASVTIACSWRVSMSFNCFLSCFLSFVFGFFFFMGFRSCHEIHCRFMGQ